MSCTTFSRQLSASKKSPAARRFASSRQLRWLVQRAIEIISEASRALPDELTDTQPNIPWPSIRGIGNVLRHSYDSLSDPIIWRVVTDELPALKHAIESIQKLSAK
jgi:uncharacterized protein with HEPN domain